MPAFLPSFEESLSMGQEVRGSIISVEDIPEFPSHSSKPYRRGAPHSVLAVSDFSTSAVLVRDKERVQHPVYYYSRALRGAEERYPRKEKLILAFVTVARKLCPYFQAHTIEVPTKYPMKKVLHKPETSGRLMKLAIELSEFDIRYRPKTAIKGKSWMTSSWSLHQQSLLGTHRQRLTSPLGSYV